MTGFCCALRRGHGRKACHATIQAVDYLHRHGMYAAGGLIVGNPEDTRESITVNLNFARRYVDWPCIQPPTPCSCTPLGTECRKRRLITSEWLEQYDGTTAIVHAAPPRGGRG